MLATLVFLLINLTFSMEEPWYEVGKISKNASGKDTYEMCLKFARKRVHELRCDKTAIIDTSEVLPIDVHEKFIFDYAYRSCREKLYKDFLPVAFESSKLIFKSKVKDGIAEVDFSHIPEGYRICSHKIYGVDKKSAKTGFRAVRLVPTDTSRPIIYSFKSTKSFADMISDIFYAKSQIASPAFHELIEDAFKDLANNEYVLFSGHSLGGALSEAATAIISHKLRKAGLDDRDVFFVGIAGYGTYGSLKAHKEGRNVTTADMKSVMGVNFMAPWDIIPRFGRHINETRKIPAKKSEHYRWSLFKIPFHSHLLSNLKKYMLPESGTEEILNCSRVFKRLRAKALR